MWLKPGRESEAKKLTKRAWEEDDLTPRELWAMPVSDLLLLYYAEPERPKPTLRELSLERGGPPYCSRESLKGCKRTRTR